MMTRERFAALLDIYGSRLDRWPEDARPDAHALLERSSEARTLRAAAEPFDAALDLAAEPIPSVDLAARVLAAAPRRAAGRRLPSPGRRRAILGAASGLAIAASLALWFVRDPVPNGPLSADAMALLGVLDVPTDALLSDTGIDLVNDTPAFGCDDPTLGCTDSEPARRSERLTHVKEIPA